MQSNIFKKNLNFENIKLCNLKIFSAVDNRPTGRVYLWKVPQFCDFN